MYHILHILIIMYIRGVYMSMYLSKFLKKEKTKYQKQKIFSILQYSTWGRVYIILLWDTLYSSVHMHSTCSKDEIVTRTLLKVKQGKRNINYYIKYQIYEVYCTDSFWLNYTDSRKFPTISFVIFVTTLGSW